MKRNHYLSKSQYIRGMQCHKALYLYKNHKELLDEVSASQQAIFSSGTDVGVLAQGLFPGGIEVPYGGLSISEQVEMTQREIAQGAKTIYEASFEYDGLFIKVDILHKGDNGWELYEVKMSTGVKTVNLHDVAFQYHVLKNSGIDVKKASLVHINNRYIRQGEIELGKLFAIKDLTRKVLAMQDDVVKNINDMRATLQDDVPAIDIGPMCKKGYGADWDCDFIGHCWKHIPEDSVFSLRGHGVKPFESYEKGVINFDDLSLDELNNRQRFQVEMHKAKGKYTDNAGLQSFLDGLWYPLCHFDFETYMSPIPLYDGTHPYQQVPFQFSLHIQREEGGPIEHYEYLAEPNVDPRPELTRRMLQDIPEDGCVLAYFMGFEKSRIKELIRDYPEYTEGLSKILENTRDLIVPFKKRYAYRWQQRGSNSLKDVLPAFIPDISYKDLEISDGGMAMQAYHLMCAERDLEKLANLRNALLVYCGLDTEAMVMLHKKLGELSVQS